MNENEMIEGDDCVYHLHVYVILTPTILYTTHRSLPATRSPLLLVNPKMLYTCWALWPTISTLDAEDIVPEILWLVLMQT